MGIKLRGPATGRNDLCPCNSVLKFKWCHDDAAKMLACDRAAFELMSRLVAREQHKRGLMSDDQYKMFKERYDPAVAPEPVVKEDVEEIMASVGLTRCDCGVPISDGKKSCVKCERKK